MLMKTISFTVAVPSFTALRPANAQVPNANNQALQQYLHNADSYGRMLAHQTRKHCGQKIRRDGWDRSNDYFSFSALFR